MQSLTRVPHNLQHDASAVDCDEGLSSQLKSAASAAMKTITGEDPDNVPVLMSGAGHDAMAMSHLTKVSSFVVEDAKHTI